MINAISSQQSVLRYSQSKTNNSKNVTFGLSNNTVEKVLDKISPKLLLNMAVGGLGLGGLATAGAGIMGFVKQASEPFDALLSGLSAAGVLIGGIVAFGAAYSINIFRANGYPGE